MDVCIYCRLSSQWQCLMVAALLVKVADMGVANVSVYIITSENHSILKYTYMYYETFQEKNFVMCFSAKIGNLYELIWLHCFKYFNHFDA